MRAGLDSCTQAAATVAIMSQYHVFKVREIWRLKLSYPYQKERFTFSSTLCLLLSWMEIPGRLVVVKRFRAIMINIIIRTRPRTYDSSLHRILFFPRCCAFTGPTHQPDKLRTQRV